MTLRLRILASALLLTGIPMMAHAPAPVRAAPEPVAEVPQVLIEGVTPGAPVRGGSVTISGRVANAGESPIYTPTVQVRFSPSPLISREEVGEVLEGLSARTGNVLPETVTALGDELDPGQQYPFSFKIPVKDLGLPGSAGVYAFGVELVSGDWSVASAGTVIPWFPKAAVYQPSQLAMLWPVSQRPAVAADRLVVDPAVAQDFLPGGRVERLVRIGSDKPVSWLIDTATVQTASQMAGGYQVRVGGQDVPGDATEAARSVSAQLRSIMTGKPWVSMPQFAVDDDDALQESDMTAMVVRSATLPPIVRDNLAPESRAGLLYVAPDGALRRQTLATLVDAGVRRVLMNDSSFPADPPLTYTPTGVTQIASGGTAVDVLLADTRLSGYLDGPFSSAAERSAALQGMLCETAMITLERPAEPRSVVAAPPMLWDPPEDWLKQLSEQLTAAPWVRLIGIDTVATAADSVPRMNLGGVDPDTVKQLPRTYVAKIATLAADLDGLLRIVDDPVGFGDDFALALQRAASSHWRRQRRDRLVLVDTVAEQLRRERDKVRVISTGTITLAGNSGKVPLTIANDLDRSVTVGVEFRANGGIGLEYDPPPPTRIEANQKAGFEVPVRVVGSQPVTVDVILTDQNGEHFSDSASFELRSTAATRIAGVIVSVGGAGLAVLVALNLWRRRRTKSAEES